MLPSERVIVPRSLAFALPAAVGVLVVVTGGQAPAHAPEHADASPVSLTHRYTARPELVVRNVPADDEAVVMTVALDPAALPLAALPLAALLGADAAGELAGAEAELLLLPLLHAATSIPTPTAPVTLAASLAGADIRFITETRISLVSCLARPGCSGPLRNDCCERGPVVPGRFVTTVKFDTGRRVSLDCPKTEHAL